MSAFVGKIRDVFSDLWLEADLFFSKFKRKKKVPDAVITSDTASLKPAAPLVTAISAEIKKEAPAIPSVPKVQSADSARKEALSVVAGAAVKKEKARSAEKLPAKFKWLRLSARERLFFYDQMATLVDSGVTLIDALSIVKAQNKKKSLKKLYDEMIHHINGGMSLADTMFLFPHIFPSMQSALIEAGEKSGNLKKVFAQIVDDLESQHDFVRKVKGAMFYPLILIALALTMVTGMLIFVIPKVAKLYEQSGQRLPALTQAVIDFSGFVSQKYPIILGGIFGSLLLLWLFFSKTRPGRLLWEKFVNAIPVFGRISKHKNIMIFASNLGMLLQSGVLISDAFKITEKTLDNLHYKRALAEIRHGIVMGKNVSEIMGLEDMKTQKFKENKLFPLQVAQLIHIGEITGTIDKMLMKIRNNYHKSINYTLKNLSTVIEPLMIFIVAILVGSILLAVMLPFFYIGTTIH
ncbi:type II secretion system F family protein [Candidatus Peregrinibacteria bacterium]|nr:type II secretion system F family protein [Candidatus Peregrinibacteria bacterium]